MRWKLGIVIGLAALPAVAIAQQQGQEQGSQDPYGQQAMQSDSTHKMQSNSTRMHHRHHHHRKTAQSSTGDVTNQNQSGVTDNSGKSTLGPKVQKTTPTQGQPVTAKGDTLRDANGQPKSGQSDSSTQNQQQDQQQNQQQPQSPQR
jgi:hypothetical protein